jgi:hypothetical protein
MMNVLDALRYRLGGATTDMEGEPIDPAIQEMLQGNLPPLPPLPPGLPLVVQDSIRNLRSYGEGDVIPGPRNPLMEQEAAAGVFEGPQRDQQLPFNRAEVLGLSNPYSDPWGDLWARAVPEGGMWSSRAPGQSPFASPLNQFLQLGRRAPLSMY